MRIRVNFTYVTGLLDGIDVMTRHHHARQHNVGAVSPHTHRRCERGTGNPTSCQLFKLAWFKAHTADTGAASLARRL